MAERTEMERALRQLVGRPTQIQLAQVVAVVPNPFQPTLNPLVRVLLQPGLDPIELRLLQFGQGPGQGLFFPVLPGQEVLVIYPSTEDGPDLDAGVAVAGLSSGANIAPLQTDGSGAILMALAGVVVRSASGLPASAILKGDLLTGGPPGAAPPTGGLAAWVAALEAFMFTVSTATTAPQIATAAVAFMAQVAQVGPTPSPFSASLTVSADPVGAGGPPFASLLNKVTD